MDISVTAAITAYLPDNLIVNLITNFTQTKSKTIQCQK